MKKIVISLLFTISMIIFSANTIESTSIGIMLNGYSINFNDNSGYPFLDENNRVLVPLRQTMEAAGYEVSWDSTNKIATVSNNIDIKVKIKIGDDFIIKEIHQNGKVESIKEKNDTYAQIINNRTFLPIRIVLESFGSIVAWDNKSKNVIINSPMVDQDNFTAESIYSKYSPAVFFLEVYDSRGKKLGSGSGFFINKKGVAITNYHVIEGASSAKIKTTDGRTYDVEGVYDFNKEIDIAKIKVKGDNFPYLNISESIEVKGGSIAYAIGSPFGFDNTISEGIISNPNRKIDNMKFYQITTPISPGSSGGALFDKNGEVIGITTLTYSDGQNINFAVPINNIFKLKELTVIKLSDLLINQEIKNNIKLSVSNSNISINENDGIEVVIDYENYEEEVFAEYLIGDTYIVEASWGNWYGSRIPLRIKGIREGQTSIVINLCDAATKEILASTVIRVNVSKSNEIPYYKGFYPAPDFGAIFGAPIFYRFDSINGTTYYYDLLSLPREINVVSYYSDLLLGSGFVYIHNFKDNEGNTVLVYNNNIYRLNLYTSLSKIKGISCYTVMILYE